ncbi:MAG TPA: ATP-binding protein [Smithella sp.]|nr:ATP-binding protein [Smithella sp.]
MALKAKKGILFNFSFWVVVGAIAVVAVVSAVMTFAHFQRQTQQAVELMVEKGATLIRSFEAGLRSPLRIKTGNFGLQKLLMETAQQPDIDYIIVTDNKGNIIADSDPAQVGDKYGLDLDTGMLASSRDIRWRQVINAGGAGTFEVYSGFFPQERAAMYAKPAKGAEGVERTGSLIIYVGLNMAAIEKADKEDTRNTMIIALILLLVGSSVIVSLFLMQAYRLAHTSLSRMTIFSDALVKNMPIGLIALDDQGMIITCNQNVQDVLSVDCIEASGKYAADVLPAPLQKILSRLPLHGGLLEQDIELMSADGREQTWEALAAGLMDEGKPAGRILLIRNVTQIRLLEKEVAKSRYLNSIGSLAAGVAHEIRNPLSSIKGFAVYFKERLSGNKDDQQTADIMIGEVERLNRVVGQLIEFARPMELKKEDVQFTELAQHAVKLIAAEAQKKQISIEIEAAAEMPLMKVDPDKIKQVLLNIFLNSLAALQDGGKLKIKISPLANNLEVIISDNGTGIEKMDLPRIYDPYFTSKPAGTGLGLAVVQKIMEAHGGNIKLESVAGKGTEVFLNFPISNTEKKEHI